MTLAESQAEYVLYVELHCLEGRVGEEKKKKKRLHREDFLICVPDGASSSLGLAWKLSLGEDQATKRSQAPDGGQRDGC